MKSPTETRVVRNLVNITILFLACELLATPPVGTKDSLLRGKPIYHHLAKPDISAWRIYMKKTMSFIGLGVIAIVLAIFLWTRKSSNAGAVKIGIILPLSGSMSEYGQNAKEGLTLAAEELAKKNDIKKVDLLYQDTKDTPQDTVNAVRRLVDVDNVRFIIGGLTSSGVLAAEPYLKRRKVLLFTPAASAPDIPDGKFVFRNWPADDAMAKKFGEEIYTRGTRKIAILNVSNDYGNTNANGFASAFETLGGSVALRRAFPQGTTDFKSLVGQLSGLKGIDRVLVIAYPDEYRAFFQELAKSTVKPDKILTSDTFYSPKVVSEIGSLAKGVVCAVAAKPGDDYEPRKAFIDAYKRRFKTPDGSRKAPGLASDTAFDALMLVVTAINKTDGTPREVANYLLHNVKDYPGAAGITTFTNTGDIMGDLALYQVKDGRFVAFGR
jgi:branched-chain amino acid transport system substrate-binding protein